MIKNDKSAFHLTLQVLFVLKIFKFLSWLFKALYSLFLLYNKSKLSKYIEIKLQPTCF